MKIWSISFIAAAMAALASAASAADIAPEPTAYDWTGFYIGLSGGYGWGNLDTSFQNNGYQASAEGVDLDAPLTENYSFDWCGSYVGGWGGDIEYCGNTDDLSGWFGGIQAGYNYQVDSFVFGLEADAFLSGIDGGGSSSWSYDYGRGDYGYTDTTFEHEVDAFGTIRARAGFAIDRFLPYVTGGLAWGSVDTSAKSYNYNNRQDTELTFNGSNSDTQWGWALGAGGEYAFTEALTMKVEYVYVDLGSVKSNFVYSDGGPYVLEDDIKFHTVKMGFNWKF